MLRTYKFYREPDGSWFVDLPEWEGSKADLQMVSGADNMLEILAQGEDSIHLRFSLNPFDGCDVLTLLELTPEIGGGKYLLKEHMGISFDVEMWLCAVTEFVFGHMPEKIYFSK